MLLDQRFEYGLFHQAPPCCGSTMCGRRFGLLVPAEGRRFNGAEIFLLKENVRWRGAAISRRPRAVRLAPPSPQWPPRAAGS
jgi:hypothetical protein